MKVAVTGSAGQLGTQVLRRLLDDRKVTAVVALDLRPPRLIGKKLSAVTADVREPDFVRHLQGCDALVHLAFVVAQQTPRGFVDSVNVGGSKNVFNACAAAGLKTLVYTSSVAAYGVVPGHPLPIVETTPRKLQESFPYSAAKYRVEEFLDTFEPAHPELAICRLRPSILIGPGMDHPLGAALRRGVVPDFGAATLPLVWNEDVADAIVLALQQRARGAFILSADQQLSAGDLARLVGFRHLRINRRVALAAARVSPWLSKLGLMSVIDRAWIESNDAELAFSSEKARRELGWKPKCNTSAEVIRRFADTVPRELDRRIARVLRLVDLGGRLNRDQVELEGMNSRVHLALGGKRGGDISITIADRRVRIRPGAPAAPDAVVSLPAQLFLDLLAGRADFATAQLTGRIRIEGQGHATLILGALVSQVLSLPQQPGARGQFGKLIQRIASSGPGADQPRNAA